MFAPPPEAGASVPAYQPGPVGYETPGGYEAAPGVYGPGPGPYEGTTGTYEGAPPSGYGPGPGPYEGTAGGYEGAASGGYGPGPGPYEGTAGGYEGGPPGGYEGGGPAGYAPGGQVEGHPGGGGSGLAHHQDPLPAPVAAPAPPDQSSHSRGFPAGPAGSGHPSGGDGGDGPSGSGTGQDQPRGSGLFGPYEPFRPPRAFGELYAPTAPPQQPGDAGPQGPQPHPADPYTAPATQVFGANYPGYATGPQPTGPGTGPRPFPDPGTPPGGPGTGPGGPGTGAPGGPGVAGKPKVLLMVGAAAIGLALIVTGFALTLGNDGAGEEPSTTAPRRTGTADDPRSGLARINSSRTDPRALTLNEVFPDRSLTVSKISFTRVRTSITQRCATAARGRFAAALSANDCDRVLRATFVDAGKDVAVTVGVAVMPDRSAALKVNERKDLRAHVWFRGLNGPAGSGGERVDVSGGYTAYALTGRYILFAHATYSDGRPAGESDNKLRALSERFRVLVSSPIAVRAAKPS